MRTPSRLQTGMSLIEIMIALLVGLFLLGGVINMFLTSKQSYRLQESLSRLQENGRFALDFIANDIRMAGFIGCNNATALANTCTAAGVPAGCKMPNRLKFNPLYSPPSYHYNFANPIQGFEAKTVVGSGFYTWSPTLDPSINTPWEGSDIITVRRAGDQFFTVNAHASSTDGLTLDATATLANLQSAGFLTSDSPPKNKCAIAVVSNCSAAAVFQVSAINLSTRVMSHDTTSTCAKMPPDDPNNAFADFDGKKFDVGPARVYPINTITYYISRGTSSTGTALTQVQPALYRRIGANPADAVELVEGIEDMQIRYGVDTNADSSVDAYIKADEVADMGQVVSVQIKLTARSMDDNLSDKVYVKDIYNDRRLRHTFFTTIALRNRIR